MARRSREGAWIEIVPFTKADNDVEVAPVRERGLKCNQLYKAAAAIPVAPVRERGLKYCKNER